MHLNLLRYRPLVLAAMAIGTGLRLATAPRFDFYGDEFWTLLWSQASVGEILGQFGQGLTMHLYVLLMKAWVYLVGFSPLMVKLPSIVAGVALIPLVFWLGKHWLEPDSAALAAVMTALNSQLFAAVLIVLALVKPHVSVPFFWIAVFVPGRLRPAALAAGGYVLLTVWAGAYQEASTIDLVWNWSFNAEEISVGAIATAGSHGNLQSWMTSLGLGVWARAAALLALAGLGGWTFVHRRRDVWLLLGVAGIFTRLWIYHGWYDDLLILPAMIALFRVVKQQDRPVFLRWCAAVALAATLCVMIAPGGQYLLPSPWKELFLAVQQTVWLLDLALLGLLARNPESVTGAGRPRGSGEGLSPATS